MKKLMLTIGLVFALSGCSVISTLEGTTISPTQVIVAGNSFDAIEATATNYLRLPLCPAAKLCRTAEATYAIIPSVRAARVARNQMEAFVTANPGTVVPVTLYNTAITAINALQSALTQYNVH